MGNRRKKSPQGWCRSGRNWHMLCFGGPRIARFGGVSSCPLADEAAAGVNYSIATVMS